jgi:lysophospholipase L1-like esterase
MAELEFEEILPYVEGEGDTGRTAREKIKRNFDKLKPLGEIPGEVQQVKREVKRKAELKDTEEDGAFFCDENGKVFMQYDEDGLDANKVSEHFKGLVAPDLSPYPTRQEVEEMIPESGQSGLGNTTEDGAFFCDENGKVFMKYDNEHGFDVNKISEHLKEMIGSPGQSGLVNTEEEGAFFCDENGKVFLKYDNEHGLDARKVSGHLKGLISGSGKNSVLSKTISLLDSSPQVLNIPDVQHNAVYTFFGKVDTFGSTSELEIRRGNPGSLTYSGTIVKITSEKIIVNNKNTVTEYSHGLTVSDIIILNISVSSSIDDTIHIVDTARITLVTSSGVYSTEHVGFVGCRDDLAVLVTNGQMSECELSWSSPDLQKDIWVLGDSYTGQSYWVRFAMSYGVNNALIDGFSGRTSPSAITSFGKLLPLGNPKVIIWAMGMNDGDTNGAINGAWLTAFQQVESACASNGIDLYVCTIPNVLPRVDNTYKNAYIRQSGHKVIDVSEAVGGEPPRQDWFTGYRGNDTYTDGQITSYNVHPSATGSKVIAAKILQSVPNLIK